MPIHNDYFKLGNSSYYPKERIVPDGKILGYLPPNRLISPKRFHYNGGNIPDAIVEQVDRVAFGGRVELTSSLQWFIFSDNYSRVPEWHNPVGLKKAQDDFVYMLNDKLAYCNAKGSYECKVFPSNHNMNSNLLPLWNEITMPGLVELVQDYPVKRGVLKESMYEYYVINAQDPEIGKYNSTDYPYRWHRPSNIIWSHVENGKVVPEGNEPFGRFLNRIKMPNLVNHTDRAFIRKEWVKVLYPGDLIPNPFTKDW